MLFGSRTVGPRLVATPEPELATARRDDLIGDEAQEREPTGEPACSGEPTVELPAHALGERGRGERALVAPAACERLAVLGLAVDDDAGAREPARREPIEEPVGERLAHERRGVDAIADRAHRLHRRKTSTYEVEEELDDEGRKLMSVVMVPEYSGRHWWDRILHNGNGKRLREALIGRANTVVLDIPYRRHIPD